MMWWVGVSPFTPFPHYWSLNEIRPKLISCSHIFKCRPRLSQWNLKEGNITIFHFYVASSAVTMATASCNTYDTPNLYHKFLSMTQQSHMFINWHVYIPIIHYVSAQMLWITYRHMYIFGSNQFSIQHRCRKNQINQPPFFPCLIKKNKSKLIMLEKSGGR